MACCPCLLGNEVLLNSPQSKYCSSLDHGNNPAHIRQGMYDNDNGKYRKYMGNPTNTIPSVVVPMVSAAQALIFLKVPEGAGQNWEKCNSLSMSTHTQNPCHGLVKTETKHHPFSQTISDNTQTIYLSSPHRVQPNPQRFSVINH